MNQEDELDEDTKAAICGAIAELDDAQIEIYRRLTPAQKFAQAVSMIDLSRKVSAKLTTNSQKTEMPFESFLKAILKVLDNADIDYILGGALAVWAYGEPRTTQDIDIVIALPIEKVNAFSAELEKIDINLPPTIILDRLMETRAEVPLNATHSASGFKAGFFLLRENDKLRNSAFERRRKVDFGNEIGAVVVHAPEDLIIYKLLTYSRSHQTKHIRDIGSILRVSDKMIDYDYITNWVETKGLSSLWQEILENI